MADDRVRIDKWLWAARFFKTRSLAQQAVDGGKVHLNDERVKSAKPVQIGDTVRVRLGETEHTVVVRGVSERRGSATIAQTLYEETEESRTRRERVREMLRYAAAGQDRDGRPTKKERRETERLKDQY